jgi:tRNA(Ile)-lysidine synthase
VPFLSARWNTRERMRRRGLSGQAGLSRLRREFLLSACRRAGAVTIATGHTADDQMETLLLRLLRGAGLQGLGAMSERRGRWIRPLLEASRDWIEADLRGAGIAWREDPSNADPRYARNRIRHDVIPALMRAADASGAPDGTALRAARGNLARRVAAGLAEIRKARRVVEGSARHLLDRAAGGGSDPRTRNGNVALDLACLRAAPPVVAGAALRLAWAGLGPGVGLTTRHMEGLRELVASRRGGARLDLPRGWSASSRGGVLRIGRATPGRPNTQPALLQRVREPSRVPGCGVR